jgi:23S rRNA pseudouridine1911/1915/1917 synthase
LHTNISLVSIIFEFMLIIATHQVLIVSEKERLSDYLTGKFVEIPTRKGIKKAILNHQVIVNNEIAITAQWVNVGDEIHLIESQSAPPKDFEIELEVPYEDDFLAIVVKPSGIPVSGNLFKTLYNALGDNLKSSSQQDKLRWPLPIHRLDTATSGLVIIAKTHAVRVELGKMLENKSIQKRYRAILQGTLLDNGSIESPIAEKNALSKFEVVENITTLKDTSLTLVNLYPITGRTHQLRIHTSSIGHPIVGDKLYKNDIAMKIDKGLFLCAVEVKFIHPVTKELLKVEIDQPAKFDSYLEREKRRVLKYD